MAAQRRDDFLLLIDVKYCCCTVCHLGLHIPRTKLVQPNPSFCSFTAAQIPKNFGYWVGDIGCSFFHRNIISCIAAANFGSVFISFNIGVRFFFTAFLSSFLFFLSGHNSTWLDLSSSCPQHRHLAWFWNFLYLSVWPIPIHDVQNLATNRRFAGVSFSLARQLASRWILHWDGTGIQWCKF